jgi:uncharacterized membrane protein YkoI
MIRMFALGLCLLAAPALADPGRHDHDHAREAVMAGDILPLSAILERVKADQPGELVETELESRHGRPVYEIKLLAPDGRLMKFRYDARSGERLERKVKP